MAGALALAAVLCAASTRGQKPEPNAATPAQTEPMWEILTSGVETSLRGIDVVAPVRGGATAKLVIWACGSNGVILKSTDSGRTWQQLSVPDGDKLDFRGVRAFGTASAYLMAAGEGDKSRIYKTTDGGATWKMQFTDTRPTFFLDAIVCDGELKCAALSDPVDGKFVIVRMTDGENWQIAPGDGMPAALKDEGSFAASNSSMIFERGPKGAARLTFVTGGPAGSRIFHSPDFGTTWTATGTPLGGSATSGVFSIVHTLDGYVIVGGDYKKPEATEKTAALSGDHGENYLLADSQASGWRSSVIVLDGKRLLAAGPNGSDVSDDDGRNWKRTDVTGFNALDAISVGKRREVWAVGTGGRVARLARSKRDRAVSSTR
jgi:photosystem II stability/assembly factor-like uncharacterized protein